MEKFVKFVIMNIRTTGWIIHGFALLHAAVTATCTLLNIPDSSFLTALTMALAVVHFGKTAYHPEEQGKTILHPWG